eukprot:13080921-Alexandrium_andersonii.AAC.1
MWAVPSVVYVRVQEAYSSFEVDDGLFQGESGSSLAFAAAITLETRDELQALKQKFGGEPG